LPKKTEWGERQEDKKDPAPVDLLGTKANAGEKGGVERKSKTLQNPN